MFEGIHLSETLTGNNLCMFACLWVILCVDWLLGVTSYSFITVVLSSILNKGRGAASIECFFTTFAFHWLFLRNIHQKIPSEWSRLNWLQITLNWYTVGLHRGSILFCLSESHLSVKSFSVSSCQSLSINTIFMMKYSLRKIAK